MKLKAISVGIEKRRIYEILSTLLKSLYSHKKKIIVEIIPQSAAEHSKEIERLKLDLYNSK